MCAFVLKRNRNSFDIPHWPVFESYEKQYKPINNLAKLGGWVRWWLKCTHEFNAKRISMYINSNNAHLNIFIENVKWNEWGGVVLYMVIVEAPNYIEKLTDLLDFLAHGSLGRLRLLAVRILQLGRRMAAVDVAPAALLFGDDRRVEGIPAEGGVRGVRRAAPALQAVGCNEAYI